MAGSLAKALAEGSGDSSELPAEWQERLASHDQAVGQAHGVLAELDAHRLGAVADSPAARTAAQEVRSAVRRLPSGNRRVRPVEGDRDVA